MCGSWSACSQMVLAPLFTSVNTIYMYIQTGTCNFHSLIPALLIGVCRTALLPSIHVCSTCKAFPPVYIKIVATSLSTGAQLEECRERMWETCRPRLRCTLPHSLHSSTPRLMDAQFASTHEGGREGGVRYGHDRGVASPWVPQSAHTLVEPFILDSQSGAKRKQFSDFFKEKRKKTQAKFFRVLN